MNPLKIRYDGILAWGRIIGNLLALSALVGCSNLLSLQPTATPTYTLTPTNTSTPTLTSTPTATPTPTSTPTPTITPTSTPIGGGSGKIAFVDYSRFTLDSLEVLFYTINADGTGLSRLGYEINVAPGPCPDWSPDGKRIAFEDFWDGLYVMNSDGTGLTLLTSVIDPWWVYQVAWSPDGTQIAFASGNKYNSEIYLINADGTGLRRLTNNALWDARPAWSPDGTQIAFVSEGPAYPHNTPRIYVINIDGTGLRRLTNFAAIEMEYNPTWSPDGTQIAFEIYMPIYTPNFTGGNEYSEIWVANIDGTGAIPLTNLGGEYDALEPSWSPDGTRIAFTVFDTDGNTDIYVIDADGSEQTPLRIDATPRCPSWLP